VTAERKKSTGGITSGVAVNGSCSVWSWHHVYATTQRAALTLAQMSNIRPLIFGLCARQLLSKPPRFHQWHRFLVTENLGATSSPTASVIATLPALSSVGYPTPFVSDAEFDLFMKPLYSHRWRVAVDTDTPGQGAVVLRRRFKFRGWRGAMAFLGDIDALARQEKVRTASYVLLKCSAHLT
jgi:hypothetical protein